MPMPNMTIQYLVKKLEIAIRDLVMAGSSAP